MRIVLIGIVLLLVAIAVWYFMKKKTNTSVTYNGIKYAQGVQLSNTGKTGGTIDPRNLSSNVI